jgi:subtilase family serine protease
MKTLLCCATLLAGSGLAANTARAADVSVVPADPGRPVAFDVFMPLRNRDKLEAFVADLHNPSSPNFHKWLTPAQFGLRFGPDTASVQTVANSLRARGFNVTVQTRSLHVTGTAAQVQQHFGTQLLIGRTEEGKTHIKQAGELKLPPEIAATGARVPSFAPQMAHVFSHRATGALNPNNRYGPTGPYWFTDLKQAYAYPSVQQMVTTSTGITAPLNGTGATIGTLISSDVLDSDIQNVFQHEAWTTVSGTAAPKLFARVPVNGGAPVQLGTGDFDEASLDTQQELTGAPGASVILYTIPDLSDGNIAAGYLKVIEQNVVDVLSSSFGGCEKEYSPAYNGGTSYFYVLAEEHELFLQGNAQGITFLASSGDSAGLGCPSANYGASGAKPVFVAGVETPASDPNVTAVGGTNLITTSSTTSLDSIYVSENGWTDPEIPYDPYGIGQNVTGGYWGPGDGYSVYFAKPSYQNLVAIGGTGHRAVPDIGMQVGGCPGGISILPCNGGNNPKDGHGNTQRSSVIVGIDVGSSTGGYFGFIGTSVASPELAGATALLVEQQGRMGNLNPYIYKLAAAQATGSGPYYHTSIPGFNGFRNTNIGPTYGFTAGVGTPIVHTFVGAPATGALAGTPLTPSNP